MAEQANEPRVLVGHPEPGFRLDALDSGRFTEVSLDDYDGRWLVVVFYSLDFTFVCPTELHAFSDRLTDAGVALRGLFLVDPDGVVQHATINNLAVGRSVDETLRVLDALRFVRQHGEVCPADWHEGDASMVPEPQSAQEWFAAHGGAAS